MATIITRSANLAALNATQHDNNLDTVCGICTEDATGTYTIAVTDQNKTLEFSNATANAVTLPAIASITGSINTSDWKVTLKTVGAGDTTISTTTAIDGSASAIVLKQYESITIQTNDARDGWNIIARDVLPLDLSTYDPAAIAEQVVGLTATQTLTNKTLTSPVINVTSDAEGDLYYRNGSGVFTRLAAGTAGQVLQTNGAAAAPSWENGVAVTGSAPAYACRAWVNFVGTGTVTINGDGNVTSITDNGTGNYTVNFTTDMPDANYAVAVGCESSSGTTFNQSGSPRSYAVDSVVVLTGFEDTPGQNDSPTCSVAVFR